MTDIIKYLETNGMNRMVDLSDPKSVEDAFKFSNSDVDARNVKLNTSKPMSERLKALGISFD